MFNNPRIMRKPAEIEVPIIPPILLKAPNRELMAEAVAATTMDVTTTMLGSFRVNSRQQSGNERQGVAHVFIRKPAAYVE